MFANKAKAREVAAAAATLLELGCELSCGGVRLYHAEGGGYAVRGQSILPPHPHPHHVEKNYETASQAIDAFLAACSQLPNES